MHSLGKSEGRGLVNEVTEYIHLPPQLTGMSTEQHLRLDYGLRV